MRASKAIPFGHYEICDYFVHDHELYQRELSEFLSVCGHTLLSIKFSCGGWKLEGSNNMDKISRLVFDLAPKLEDLCIHADVPLPCSSLTTCQSHVSKR